MFDDKHSEHRFFIIRDSSKVSLPSSIEGMTPDRIVAINDRRTVLMQSHASNGHSLSPMSRRNVEIVPLAFPWAVFASLREALQETIYCILWNADSGSIELVG